MLLVWMKHFQWEADAFSKIPGTYGFGHSAEAIKSIVKSSLTSLRTKQIQNINANKVGLEVRFVHFTIYDRLT